MAQYGRGAKAGLLAGLISGVLTGVFLYLELQNLKSQITTTIQNSLPANSPIDASALANFAILLVPVVMIIGGLIGGLILGLIFAAVQDKYMKRQSLPVRGLVFGLILFAIDLLLNAGSVNYGTSALLSGFTISLIGALIFGYLLGAFFQRFGPALTTEKKSYSSSS
jgi:hypothetical protein